MFAVMQPPNAFGRRHLRLRVTRKSNARHA
jgi:hypothetical protein